LATIRPLLSRSKFGCGGMNSEYHVYAILMQSEFGCVQSRIEIAAPGNANAGNVGVE
jgi:hypothetical protein